jgi:GR25 family glycosyltransferase involved in LPS biosynthesis
MQIYINLDRSVERRKQMEKKFPNAQRFKAYDGRDPETIKILQSRFEINPDYSMLEYACLLSRLKTILLFSKSSYDYALVLEDDASLDYKPYWRTTFMECIQGAPKGWEILQLCFFGTGLPKHLYSPKHHFSTTAYIICKAGAKKIMKIIFF